MPTSCAYVFVRACVCALPPLSTRTIVHYPSAPLLHHECLPSTLCALTVMRPAHLPPAVSMGGGPFCLTVPPRVQQTQTGCFLSPRDISCSHQSLARLTLGVEAVVRAPPPPACSSGTLCHRFPCLCACCRDSSIGITPVHLGRCQRRRSYVILSHMTCLC